MHCPTSESIRPHTTHIPFQANIGANQFNQWEPPGHPPLSRKHLPSCAARHFGIESKSPPAPALLPPPAADTGTRPKQAAPEGPHRPATAGKPPCTGDLQRGSAHTSRHPPQDPAPAPDRPNRRVRVRGTTPMTNGSRPRPPSAPTTKGSAEPRRRESLSGAQRRACRSARRTPPARWSRLAGWSPAGARACRTRPR